MDTLAVILEEPERLSLNRLALNAPGPDDVVVEAAWTGISTGTERLLYAGRMPSFPGMGYPLVPGYEAVGTIVDAGGNARGRIGETVFAPGSTAFQGARGLFGAAARTLVAPAARVAAIPETLGREGVLLALAATAHHAIAAGPAPELIVGHGVLGRLLARLTIAGGATPPTVWEINPARRDSDGAYAIIAPDDDPRRDYRAICEASGAQGILDTLVARLAKGGEICLAGFYEAPLSFAFPPAFMRETRIRIAAEFTPADVAAVLELLARGRLSLDGLITHAAPAHDAPAAYHTAFTDPRCLKMALDWSMAA